MIVPDASVTALLFGDPAFEPRAEAATRLLYDDPGWLVPEHWSVEVLSTVRGLLLGKKLDAYDANSAVDWLRSVTVAVEPTAPHIDRIWKLRDNLSAYDAGYVAVAEWHNVTLVTADARIAAAGVARCAIQVVT